MAMEPTTLATVASIGSTLLGTAMQHRSQADAIKAQQKQARRAAENQSRLQREADLLVQEAAGQYDPNVRNTRRDEAAREQAEYLTSAVMQGRDKGDLGLNAPISGKVSQDYLTKRAEADVATAKRAVDAARMLGKIAGPGRQRQGEGVKLGDLAANLSMMGNFSGGQHGVDRLKYQAAGRADPWMMAGGAGLRAAAPAFGGFAGSMAPARPPPLPVSTTGGYPIASHGGFTYNLPNFNIKARR